MDHLTPEISRGKAPPHSPPTASPLPIGDGAATTPKPVLTAKDQQWVDELGESLMPPWSPQEFSDDEAMMEEASMEEEAMKDGAMVEADAEATEDEAMVDA